MKQTSNQATDALVDPEYRRRVQGLQDVTAALNGVPSSTVVFSTDAGSVLNRKVKTIQSVDASQPQHTPAGRLLGVMYYSGFLDAVLQPEEHSGYPHNGGSHTLNLRLDNMDLNAFLGLIQETFASRLDQVDEFIHSVLSKKVTSKVVALRC